MNNCQFVVSPVNYSDSDLRVRDDSSRSFCDAWYTDESVCEGLQDLYRGHIHHVSWKSAHLSSSSSGYRSEIQYWNVTLTTVTEVRTRQSPLKSMYSKKFKYLHDKTIYTRGLLRCGWRLDCYRGMGGILEGLHILYVFNCG